MSEQEFDLYLRLMSRLLKLSQEQERAIADELRDHMQERFTELVRAGLSREQAIERALTEFGDAASLAGEFSALAAKRRRRFWGRLSLAGTGAAALVTVGLVSLWPAAKPMNAPNQTLVAQEKPAALEPQQAVAAALSVDTVDIAKTLPAELAKSCELDFTDIPLSGAIRFLADLSTLPVMPDRSALTDAGVDLENFKITMTFRGPLHLAMDRLCEAVRGSGTPLAWTYRDEVLRITTADVARDRRFVQSYDTSRLTAKGLKAGGIAPLLTGATSAPWSRDEPGTSTINPIGTQLVIDANSRQHREIAALIAALEGGLDRHADVLWSDETAATLAAAAALELPTEVEFSETPLTDVAAFLSDLHQTSLLIDRAALADTGLDPDQVTVSLTIANRPLRTVLELLLSDVQGGQFVVVPHLGALWITTVDRASELRRTAVYRVAEFEQAGVMPELVSTILATTGPWDGEEPGTGTLQQPHPQLLVIRQTAAVHRQIQKLVEQQRKSLPVITAEQRAALDQRIETRAYRLAGEKEEDLVQVIRTTIAPEQWGAEEDPKSERWIRRIRVGGQTGFEGGGGGGMGGGGAMGGGGGGFFQFGGGGFGGSQLQQGFPTNTTVLLVRQSRAVHRQIDSLIHAVRHVAFNPTGHGGPYSMDVVPQYGVEFDPQAAGQLPARGREAQIQGVMGGFGGGGGGGGGGFFSIP